jgi:drug/metabolite transporter (DMT)-like permease
VDYALTLVAALLLGIGFVLQQHAAEQAPQSHFLSLKLVGDLFRNRIWLAGIVIMVLGQILAAWSIGHLELSIVEPLLTTNLLFALILAVPLSNQAVRVTEVAGALLLIAGEAILSLARSTQPIGQSFGSFSHWPMAALIAGVAFAAVQAGRQRSGRYRATLTGLGAGLVFGIQDALTRQALQILQAHGLSGLLYSWSLYCLVATGAVGILLMQNAFSAGPLHSSLPTIAAGEPVAGILLGIVVFGDRISLTPGSLALQAGGLFALVVGVIAVARAPALTNLRKVVVEPVHLPHPHRRDPRPDAPSRDGADAATRHGQSGATSRSVQADQATSGNGRLDQEAPRIAASASPGRPADPDQPDAPAAHRAAPGQVAPAAPELIGPIEPVRPTSPVSPVSPVSTIGPLNGNGTNGPNGPNGLMAPAEPPMAVPPDPPLEPHEIAEF